MNKGKKKIFVSGCFDMLHSGHVAFLQEAAQYGDLYIGLGSDKTIKDLKGRETVYSEEERAYMLSALKCVHKVAINRGSGLIDFAEDIKILRPDGFIVNEDGHSRKGSSVQGTWNRVSCSEKDTSCKSSCKINHSFTIIQAYPLQD